LLKDVKNYSNFEKDPVLVGFIAMRDPYRP